jgi:hypothetical protein
LHLDAADLAALAARAGDPLDGAVGDYAAKAAGEDQAETARWMMSDLATALWQAAEHPALAGSPRVLHVLAAYTAAGRAGACGPDAAWLTDSPSAAIRRGGARSRGGGHQPVPRQGRRRDRRPAVARRHPRGAAGDGAAGRGSGVNLAPAGRVLTAAHVVDEIG